MTKPIMERRHFELIADAVRKLGTHHASVEALNFTPEQRRSVAYQFAMTLKPTNPNFNRARFLTACGVED